MADVRRSEVDLVICFELGRLGRSLPHLAQIVGELTAHRAWELAKLGLRIARLSGTIAALYWDVRQKVIVHIDDSEDELSLFRLSFEKSGLKDWQLQSLADGQMALDYLGAVHSGRAQKPNLVLLDLKMPVVHGFAILSWLRANLPDVKTIVLSSSELKTDQDRAAELGAVAYLPKSGSFSAIMDLLQPAMDPEKQPTATRE